MQKLRTEGKNGRMETGLDDVVIYNWGHKIKSLNFLFAWFFLHSCMNLFCWTMMKFTSKRIKPEDPRKYNSPP